MTHLPKTMLARLTALLLAAVLALSGIALTATQPAPVQAQDGDEAPTPEEVCAQANTDSPDNRTFDQPEDVLEDGVDYGAVFCTEVGPVYVDLFEELTPTTVNNFVFLAQNGFYNNTTFHRVLPDFMVQGGDPTGTGSGGPGYQFQDEFVPFLGFNQAGLLAMANSGPDTNGSQFFITREPTPWLNGRHTIFGQVLEGQSVVDEMPNRDPDNPEDAQSPGTTLDTVVIVTAEDNVATDFERPAPYTSQEIQDELDILPVEGFSVVEEETGLTEGDFGDFGSADVAAIAWQATECPAQPDLLGLALQVVDWQDRDTASQVLADTDFVQGQLAEGFAPLEAPDLSEGLLFTAETSACDMDSTTVRYVWARDRYTLIVDFTVGQGLIPDENLPVVARNVATSLERSIGDVIFRAVMQ